MHLARVPTPSDMAGRPTPAAGNTGAARPSKSAWAHRELASERAALDPSHLQPANRDIGRVIVAVLGAIPALKTLRSAIVEALPGFDIARFDRLESYALSLAHAQAEYLKAPATRRRPTELARQARRWRDELLGAVQCLAARGLVPEPNAPMLERRRAYGPLALGVLALAAFLDEHWPAITGKTAFERSDLSEATEVARRLLQATAVPRRRPERRAERTVRDQAFTLLTRAYADARRAVRYLRWHERDADCVAPSLYRRTGRRRSRLPVGVLAEPVQGRAAPDQGRTRKKITSRATGASSGRRDVHVSAIEPSQTSNSQNRRLTVSTTETRNENAVSSSSSFSDAYEAVLPEIQAVPDSDLVHISIDVTAAAVTALGALPEIRTLRTEIAENLPKFDLGRFDKLETYTQALVHEQALYRSATAPKGSVSDLAAGLMNTRDLLFSDASALSRRGLINPERLKEFKASNGYREVAIDVLGLAALLREHWSSINGKTAVTLADLDQAAGAVEQMLVALGVREQSPAAIGEVVKNRQKAFTLFVRTYDDARRAVAYLRPDEVDDIAPSLYAGRAPRRKSSDDATAPAGSATTAGTASAAAPVVSNSGLPLTSPFQD
jgi:hypothetical protein